MGILGWTPDEFWAATPEELTEAYEGRAEINGWKAKTPGMTRKRLDELMAQYPD